MLNTRRLLILNLSLTVAATAFATASKQVYRDTNGMPRCLAAPSSPTNLNESRGLLFRWNSHDLYRREIKVVSLVPTKLNLQINQNSKQKKIVIDCAHWYEIVQRISFSDYPILSEDQNTYGSVSIPENVQFALRQVRRGGSVFREEKTAAEFLQKHPMDFSQEMNRKLSPQYGVGFISELYQAWEEAKPQNAVLKKLMTETKVTLPTRGTPFLKELFQDKKVILVRGLGNELEGAKRYHVLEDDLQMMGLDLEVVAHSSAESIATNRDLLLDNLRAKLRKGEHLIVIGLSKGGAEVLGALLELGRDREERPTEYPGSIDAFVGFSPVVNGSFIIDWAKKFPYWELVKGLLRHEYRKGKIELSRYEGFLDLQKAFMKSYLGDKLNELPIEFPYYNIVGILPDDGLSKEKGLRKFQDSLTRGLIRRYGANDGYIEYPGTSLPDMPDHEIYTLVTHASHGIVDGTYDDLDLNKADERWKMIGSLFLNIGQKHFKGKNSL